MEEERGGVPGWGKNPLIRARTDGMPLTLALALALPKYICRCQNRWRWRWRYAGATLALRWRYAGATLALRWRYAGALAMALTLPILGLSSVCQPG